MLSLSHVVCVFSFILEKCDGKLTIENKKRKDMISELARKGYDSDPVKKWQQAHLAPGTTDGDQGEVSFNQISFYLVQAQWISRCLCVAVK